MVILSLPWIKSVAIQRASLTDSSSFIDDLSRLGLLNPNLNGRSVFLGDAGSLLPVLISNRIEPVEIEQKAEIADSTVEYLFSDRTVDFEFVDRVLTTGGIFTVRLSSDSSDRFVISPDYKIVHISLSNSGTIMSLRKTPNQAADSRRKLLSITESKKEALNWLEDAVLEPPTRKKYRQKTKYLPDLMGGSLADYPRRVFIDVGPAGRAGSERWFEKHYPPKKDLEFDVIRIDEIEGGGGVDGGGMSEWLKRNVEEEEYVVMKAEAEVVEEMVKGRAIGLVDELFLECKNQWMRGKKSKRAYWECLALYGRLKDEGVAVHQWWDY